VLETLEMKVYDKLLMQYQGRTRLALHKCHTLALRFIVGGEKGNSKG
jgi:hypothetical protein